MIRCGKCDNDTRASALVTEAGPVMLAGTLGTDPQPILAQVCTACGHIELYGPQPIGGAEPVHQRKVADAELDGAADALPAL